MKRYEVILETSAIRDIDQATGWIAQHSADLAQRWFDAIEVATLALKELPEQHPFARENGHYPYELRQLIYGKKRDRYRIIFTVRTNTVHVLHVRHGARPGIPLDELGELDL